MEKKTYRYFIAFSYEGKINSGNGNAISLRTKKINNYEDIKDIQDEIQKNNENINKVCIQNFILLEGN